MDIPDLNAIRQAAYQRSQEKFKLLQEAFVASHDHERQLENAVTTDQQSAHCQRSRELLDEVASCNMEFLSAVADHSNAIEELRRRGVG